MSDKAEQISLTDIAELRDQHIGRLLLRAQRGFSVRSVRKLQKLGHTGLSLAQTLLLANLDLDGTRITTLAERAGVTKQAMGQLVQELEGKGYITRSVDPNDKRATVITFTDTGWQFLQDANQVKKEIEAEYEAVLGQDGLLQLRELLGKLIDNEAQQAQSETE